MIIITYKKKNDNNNNIKNRNYDDNGFRSTEVDDTVSAYRNKDIIW